MIIKEITDEDFISAFLYFTRHARPSVNFILEELIEDNSRVKSGEKRAIYLQILENYILITESVLMLLSSFHQKYLEPNRSLVSIYTKTFIREGKGKEDTKEMLEYLTAHSNKEILAFLGLKSHRELIELSSPNKKKEAEKIWGSIDAAFKQGDIELNNLRESLIIILHNRIFNKDKIEFPFYKVLNKLKHGYQIIPDPSSDIIHILIDVVEEKKDSTKFEVINIPYSVANVKWFSQQSRIMQKTVEHLLMLYSFNLN